MDIHYFSLSPWEYSSIILVLFIAMEYSLFELIYYNGNIHCFGLFATMEISIILVYYIKYIIILYLSRWGYLLFVLFIIICTLPQ